MEIRTLHRGVDSLDVAFQGAVPSFFLSALADARALAQEARRPVEMEWKGARVEVERSGVSGFKYSVSTGEDGWRFFFKHVERTWEWNIRCSATAYGMLTKGYKAMVAEMWEWLEVFGARIVDHKVQRVDVAVDFEAPDFQVIPENFVCHWRCKQSEYRGFVEESAHIVRQGRQINSYTIGKMPNRQVIVYDKRREVIDGRKLYWFDHWGVDRSARVWRVEVRAGKDHIAQWGVRTLAEVEAALPSIMGDALQAIRLHADEQTDTNVTRQAVHPLWQAAAREVAALDLAEPVEAERVAGVVEGRRRELRERYEALMGGLAAAYTHVLGLPADPADPRLHAVLGPALSERIRAFPAKFMEARRRAARRLKVVDFHTGSRAGAVSFPVWAAPGAMEREHGGYAYG